jgi:hypothetical protein
MNPKFYKQVRPHIFSKSDKLLEGDPRSLHQLIGNLGPKDVFGLNGRVHDHLGFDFTGSAWRIPGQAHHRSTKTVFVVLVHACRYFRLCIRPQPLATMRAWPPRIQLRHPHWPLTRSRLNLELGYGLPPLLHLPSWRELAFGCNYHCLPQNW